MHLGPGWVSRIITLRNGNLIVIDASSHLTLTPWPAERQLPLADGYFGPLIRHQQPRDDAVDHRDREDQGDEGDHRDHRQRGDSRTTRKCPAHPELQD
jgi:hypothetical protein